MPRDWLPTDLRRRRALEDRLAAVFEAAGYAGVDVPVVEPADLYLRKFGGQALARTVVFTDGAGRRLSVRPEFTASVVRILAEQSPALPLRWYYLGPVVRLGPDGGVIEFHQAGVELVGMAGPDADAEVLELLGRALAEAGIRGFQLKLNHLGIILGLFDKLGLAEPLTTFFIASLDEVAAGNLPPELARYLEELAEAGESDGLREVLAAVGPEGARRLVLSVLESIAGPGRTGRRGLDAFAAGRRGGPCRPAPPRPPAPHPGPPSCRPGDPPPPSPAGLTRSGARLTRSFRKPTGSLPNFNWTPPPWKASGSWWAGWGRS